MTENPYDTPKVTLSDTADVSLVGERPLVISVVCVVMAVCFGSLLFVLPMMVSQLTDLYGGWYVPVWFISVSMTVASVVGYWRMRRWGVYLYTVAFVVFSGLGLAMGVPFTVAGVVVPVSFIALGFAYFRRMR